MLRRLLALATVVLLAACDSLPAIEPPEYTPDEPAPTTVPLQPLFGGASLEDGTDHEVPFIRGLGGFEPYANSFKLRLFPDAKIDGGTRSGAADGVSIYAAGIWLAGTQGGGLRSSIVYFDSGFTNTCSGEAIPQFALDADLTYTGTEEWPRDLGAPTNADGSPRVYGDRMLWGSFCTRAVGADRHATPIENLRVNVAAFDHEDRPGVRYVRYDVTNTGSIPITDLRVGHFADVDSPGYYDRPSGVGGIFRTHDAVGYDEASGFSYVYQLPFSESDSSYSQTWVSGFSFLETPEDAPLLSHRILFRYAFYEPAGFGPGPVSSLEVRRALDGLSYTGDPMIDPRTGNPSAFAFPTNPFENTTGWLDGRDENGVFSGYDVRQLLSAGPVTLDAGETVTLTVVWVTADGGTTSFDSYQEVQTTLAAVRAERALWDF